MTAEQPTTAAGPGSVSVVTGDKLPTKAQELTPLRRPTGAAGEMVDDEACRWVLEKSRSWLFESAFLAAERPEWWS